MATTVVLIDRCPPCLQAARCKTSLLLSPLGPTTPLAQLARQAPLAAAHGWTVLADGAPDTTYVDTIRGVIPNAGVLRLDQLGELLDTLEPSDWLLLIETRHYPMGELDRRLLADGAPSTELARHLVHLRRAQHGTQEHVVCDEDNRVRRIQRLYDGVTSLELAAVSASHVSVQAVRRIHDLRTLDLVQLRAHLSAAGVPSRDVAAVDPALDLLEREDLLALNERITAEAVRGRPPAPFKQAGAGVWLGPACQVHRTSRIYGPVIVHANVRIDADAVIVGPAVLGPEARIDRGGLVSQSLIGAGAHVRPGAAVVCDILAPGADRAERPAEETAWESCCRNCRVRQLEPLAAPAGAAVDAAHERHRRAASLKRAVDIVLAALGLATLLPLFVVVGALVKLTSRGPIFFRHPREGCGGRVFSCWKFRTMVAGADALQRALYRTNAVDGPQFKLANDPRITWLGSWLRTTNIDELPQLLNVLWGQMSLIGPRPSPFRENQICVPWRNARLSVRPGITGLWQVCRHDREVGDFHQWIWLDTLYVRHWSLTMDVRILLATVGTLGGRWSVPLAWIIPARKLQPGGFVAGPHSGTQPLELARSPGRATEPADVLVTQTR